jgi:hypothetical protein
VFEEISEVVPLNIVVGDAVIVVEEMSAMPAVAVVVAVVVVVDDVSIFVGDVSIFDCVLLETLLFRVSVGERNTFTRSSISDTKYFREFKLWPVWACNVFNTSSTSSTAVIGEIGVGVAVEVLFLRDSCGDDCCSTISFTALSTSRSVGPLDR